MEKRCQHFIVIRGNSPSNIRAMSVLINTLINTIISRSVFLLKQNGSYFHFSFYFRLNDIKVISFVQLYGFLFVRWFLQWYVLAIHKHLIFISSHKLVGFSISSCIHIMRL